MSSVRVQNPDDATTWSTDPRDWSADVLVRVITDNLAGDLVVVDAALRRLAIKDPQRAERVLTTMRAGIAIARERAEAQL